MSDLTKPVGSPASVAKSQAPGTGERFQILKSLGGGGMGDVYLAQDLRLPRLVAIKTIRQDLCENAEVRKRIQRECQLHATIGVHPHIVALHDLLEEDGQISMVMEYVEGQTLHDLLQQMARQGISLSWQQAIDIARQTLDALARIHAHGIVHRDIKPSNILLSRDDAGRYCAKLMDFGIARPQVDEGTALTVQGGSGPGTPMYMAPEQIDSKTFGAVSPVTDIYAMGVVLFQLLSGQLPFEGTLTAVFMGHLTREPPPLVIPEDRAIPSALMEIVQRALKKNPAERFPSAKTFREALDQVWGQVADRSGETATVVAAHHSMKTASLSPPGAVSTPQARDMAIRPHNQSASVGSRGSTRRLALVFGVILLVGTAALLVAQQPAVRTQVHAGLSRLGWFSSMPSEDALVKPATVADPAPPQIAPVQPHQRRDALSVTSPPREVNPALSPPHKQQDSSSAVDANGAPSPAELPVFLTPEVIESRQAASKALMKESSDSSNNEKDSLPSAKLEGPEAADSEKQPSPIFAPRVIDLESQPTPSARTKPVQNIFQPFHQPADREGPNQEDAEPETGKRPARTREAIIGTGG